jgi:hypothetical protein
MWAAATMFVSDHKRTKRRFRLDRVADLEIRIVGALLSGDVIL